MSLKGTLTRPLYRLYEERLQRGLDLTSLPHHIGVIHDGHRRYARATGLPDYEPAYRVGMSKVVDLLGWSREVDIPNVTCWLLSEANLSRSPRELEPYFNVLVDLLDRLGQRAAATDTRVRVIGQFHRLPYRLQEATERLHLGSTTGRRRVTIALAYAGRQEIVDAVRDLVGKLAADGLEAEEIAAHIDSAALSEHLYTADLPDPDLVIRTSGESRLSGFLLWQAAYAEYSFADVYWPAFRRVDFLRALRDFTRRDRRFGQ